MHVYPDDDHRRFVVDLNNDERSALVWALEVGRALVLGEPELPVLAGEATARPELLDALADGLFLAGCHVAPGE